MKPIDTKTWKEFKISDLFEIENGKYVDPKTLTIDDNGSPYLRASIFNNGQDVDKYTGEGFKTKPNIISWGKQSPFFSYHTKACYTGQGIYWFKFDKGQNVAHFICTVLQRVGKNYNYQNCLTGAKLKHETIQLPVDQTGQPDWDYMEAFMEQINQQAQARLDEYKEGKLEYTTLDSKIGYTPVDTESWAEFKVGDLFDINSSKKIYHAINVTIIPTQEDGYYSYVVRQKSNNGIRGYIQEDLESLNPANTISFAQDTAEMFWQSQPYFTGNKVKVMSVKNQELTELISLFLISGLKRAFSNFRYISSYTVDNIKNVALKLPIQQIIDPDKTYHPEGYIPDWDYMEAFMKQINQQAQAKLDTLEKGKA